LVSATAQVFLFWKSSFLYKRESIFNNFILFFSSYLESQNIRTLTFLPDATAQHTGMELQNLFYFLCCPEDLKSYKILFYFIFIFKPSSTLE